MQISFRKALFIICMLGTCAPVAFSQSRDSLDLNTVDGMNRLREKQLNPHARVYVRARALGDYHSTIYALHHLLLEDPGNTYLQDSLAFMYIYAGNPAACLAWCDQCLQKRPESLFLLNLSAGLLESGAQLKEALARYEKIHSLTGSHFYRYKVAGLQFRLGRHGECLVNIESMLQDSSTEKEMVQLSWDNVARDVPLHAALHNLRGNLELELNQENKARKSFREALKIDPDFGLARNNLRALDEKARERTERRQDR